MKEYIWTPTLTKSNRLFKFKSKLPYKKESKRTGLNIYECGIGIPVWLDKKEYAHMALEKRYPNSNFYIIDTNSRAIEIAKYLNISAIYYKGNGFLPIKDEIMDPRSVNIAFFMNNLTWLEIPQNDLDKICSDISFLPKIGGYVVYTQEKQFSIFEITEQGPKLKKHKYYDQRMINITSSMQKISF